MYLYKGVDVNFLITFKILSRLQELSYRKVNETYLVNLFCITLSDIFVGPKFLILPESLHARG